MPENDLKLNDTCQRALELHTLALLNEPISAADREFLVAHVPQCPACLEMSSGMSAASSSLETAFSSIPVSDGFAVRTMAALPATPVQPVLVKSSQGAQVFSAAPRRSLVPWAFAAAAAIVALVTMISMLTTPGNSNVAKAGNVTVRKGKLLDANGQMVTSLAVGNVYRVSEDAVLPLNEFSTIKVQKGAEFALQSAEAEPELRLQSGDLYAWGRENGKVTRVQCADFRTLLRNGDFFVANESGVESAGIVIVFNGQAEVTDEEETTSLRAGQIFLRMGTDDLAVSQVLEMSDAVVRIVENNTPVVLDTAAMRREYENRVQGYRRELEALKSHVKTEQDAQRLAELRERQQRVTAYYEAHKRRLETLKHNVPLEGIRRGLNGHRDPSTWL